MVLSWQHLDARFITNPNTQPMGRLAHPGAVWSTVGCGWILAFVKALLEDSS